MAMTLRPDKETAAALTAMAKRENVPQAEIIRRAVLERAARQQRELLVDAAYEHAAQRWRPVLDRLSDS